MKSGFVSFIGRPAAMVVASGLAAGVLGSLLIAKLIESQLWGVTGTDPATISVLGYERETPVVRRWNAADIA